MTPELLKKIFRIDPNDRRYRRPSDGQIMADVIQAMPDGPEKAERDREREIVKLTDPYARQFTADIADPTADVIDALPDMNLDNY